MTGGYQKRLPVIHSKEINISSSNLWQLICAPGNLNDCHPFCKSNDVIQWNKEVHSDRLIYLNGLNYIRKFQTWDEGNGYTLLIGEENGPQSYVKWNVESLDENKSRLTIIVYPFILAKIPKIIALIPHFFWVRPRLKKYLNSVISGFEYFYQHSQKVPRNHFGTHPWFS